MHLATKADLLESFSVNVISAHVITAALIHLLDRGQLKKVINV